MSNKLNILFRRFIRHRYLSLQVILAIDTLVAAISSLAAYVLVSLLIRSVVSFYEGLTLFVFSIAISLAASLIMKNNRHIIRHSTLKDMWRVAATVVIKVAGMMIVAFMCINWSFLSDNQVWLCLIFDALFTVFCLVGIRVFMIALFEAFMSSRSSGRQRILIYGIDEKSVALKIRLSDSDHFSVVGFYTFGKAYKSHRVSGLPIYYFNDKKSVSDFLCGRTISGILFARQTDVKDEQDRLIAYLEQCKVKALIAPSINEANQSLMQGGVRDIKIEDLLGREEIAINMEEVRNDFRGKTIFVTGAAGSIGSELCRQIARLDVRQIILFDSAETPLHNLQLEFEQKYPALNFVPVIGDVRIRTRLKMVFEKYNPQIVLHAAAYKHVPLMENNPCEAVLVNVIGTRNMADLAVQYQVEKMIMVSTDKAVNPTNVMGASKRLAEIYVQSLGCAIKDGKKAGRTSFVTTRFGNVLGSNGSVIPRFKEQIEKGGPVTVTHPDIIRYFMTIPEACRLVLEAATMGVGNEIFIFEMGQPVRIADLAHRMITLAGFEPGKDIKIEYTGLRPGEKLYEELLADEENTLPTIHEKINIAKVRKYEYEAIEAIYATFESLARAIRIEDTVRLMKRVVPEFKSNNSDFEAFDNDPQPTEDVMEINLDTTDKRTLVTG